MQARQGMLFPQQLRPGIPFPQVRPAGQGSALVRPLPVPRPATFAAAHMLQPQSRPLPPALSGLAPGAAPTRAYVLGPPTAQHAETSSGNAQMHPIGPSATSAAQSPAMVASITEKLPSSTQRATASATAMPRPGALAGARDCIDSSRTQCLEANCSCTSS
jgi:hypothetical protein